MPANAATAKSRTASAKPAARKAAKTGGAPAKPEKKEKKVKVVRDSFTMPQNDYAMIDELKQVCQKAGLQVKKSELLRAGLHALAKLSAAQLKQTLSSIEQIKTGRPKKG